MVQIQVAVEVVLKMEENKNMTREHQLAGFSIIEVTVAALIFTLTAVGIVSTIASLRMPSATSQKDLHAAYYAQNILDDLRARVDERTWMDSNSPLAVGTHALPPNDIYNAVYTVADDGAGRNIVLNITW